MEVKYDLLIAAASAGLLVYSGRLLVPAARLRPEDIIAYKYLPGQVSSASIGPDPLGVGMVPWPIFPEGDTALAIRDVLDSKVGFDLLVFGTIGGVVAIIVGAFTLSWNHPSGLDVAAAVAALALGYGAGWWWKTGSGWYRRQERRLLVHCFLAWLEREVGDPETKGYDFGLAVVSTARTSGFTLLGDLVVPLGMPRSEAEDRAAARRIVAVAREHRYPWRRDQFRAWAKDVASWSD